MPHVLEPWLKRLEIALGAVAAVTLAFGTYLVLAILTADWVAPKVAAVTGSATPEEFGPRTVATIVGQGDFVTRAPDGEAFAAVEFNSPQAFVTIRHSYTLDTWPIFIVKKAAVQWSDDGRSWNQAAVASAGDGTLSFKVSRAGMHTHWRFVVLESGSAPETVIGRLSFSAQRGVLAAGLDVAWLCCGLGALGACLTFRGGLTRRRAFVAVATSTAMFIVTYGLFASPHWLNATFDSATYTQRISFGFYHVFRNIGYPNFLRLIDATVGFEHLALVQLTLELVCFMTGLAVLSYAYRLWIGGAILAVGAVFFGIFVYFAAFIWTESLFISGLMLAAASVASAVRRPALPLFMMTGLGLAIATTAKSVGIVLVLPALLCVRFLPLRYWGRAVPFVAIPSVAIYLVMAAHAYQRTGVFMPESAGGLALLGHVAGYLTDEVAEFPDLLPTMQQAIRPVLARRPPTVQQIRSKAELDAYVDYTTNEYNQLLWSALFPELNRIYERDFTKMNHAAMRVAVASIAAHPLGYMRHVAAHFYGLWRDTARSSPDLPLASVRIRETWVELIDSQRSYVHQTFGRLLDPLPTPEQANAAVDAQRAVPLQFRRVLTAWSQSMPIEMVGIGIGMLSLLLCALFLVPGPLAHAYCSEIMLALILNAYALGHAAFQVTLDRYAWVMTPVMFFMVACFAATTTRLIFAKLVPPSRAAAKAGAVATP